MMSWSAKLELMYMYDVQSQFENDRAQQHDVKAWAAAVSRGIIPPALPLTEAESGACDYFRHVLEPGASIVAYCAQAFLCSAGNRRHILLWLSVHNPSASTYVVWHARIVRRRFVLCEPRDLQHGHCCGEGCRRATHAHGRLSRARKVPLPMCLLRTLHA